MAMDEVRVLLTGRGLVESPRWHGDRLYFSDWSAGEVVAVDLTGRSEVVAKVDSVPLCTAWLPDSRLVIVSSSQGQLLRLEPDGSLVTYADLGGAGWNDIVADGRGNIYVNRAGFNPMAGEAFRPGSVCLVAPDGSARQVADDIATAPPTESAPTPRTPSGTPTSPAGAASASPKAAPSCRPSTWTAAASPAPWAAPNAPPCSSSPPPGKA